MNQWHAEHERTLVVSLTVRPRLDIVTYLCKADNTTVVRETPHFGQKGKQRPRQRSGGKYVVW